MQQKTKEHIKYSYMYVYTRMIFAAVLSSAIKIFHRHLGPNLLIFAVKVSPWFHRHFTVILWHITDISPRKNTDQGDFLLKRAVRAVGRWSWFYLHIYAAKYVYFWILQRRLARHCHWGAGIIHASSRRWYLKKISSSRVQ